MASAFPHQASSMKSVYYVFHGNRVAWLSDHGRLAERAVFLSLACTTRCFVCVCCERVMLILRLAILRAIPCCQSWVFEDGLISCYKSQHSSSILRRCTYVTTTQHCNPYGTGFNNRHCNPSMYYSQHPDCNMRHDNSLHAHVMHQCTGVRSAQPTGAAASLRQGPSSATP